LGPGPTNATPLPTNGKSRWADDTPPSTFKFLVNDLTWSAGEDYVVEPGSTVTLVSDLLRLALECIDLTVPKEVCPASRARNRRGYFPIVAAAVTRGVRAVTEINFGYRFYENALAFSKPLRADESPAAIRPRSFGRRAGFVTSPIVAFMRRGWLFGRPLPPGNDSAKQHPGPPLVFTLEETQGKLVASRVTATRTAAAPSSTSPLDRPADAGTGVGSPMMNTARELEAFAWCTS